MAVTAGDEGLPERIGPYRIRRRIGQGGMGVVYQAVDTRDNFVAIKVLKPEVAGDHIARARLAREVETMRRVHSPNVAEVIDADTDASQPWVVTEYIPGPTLDATVTDHGPLRGRALSRFITGLARALDAIHAADVIHRDLKPGNVIISNGEPIVIDFGIAHAVDGAKLTQTGTFVGTPSYLSPEVIEGTDLSPATDVHAWGATVAFAATGKAPYGAGAFEVIFFRILNGEIDMEGMPEALQPLVQQAVSRDMSQRPTAADLVRETERINLDLPLADNAAYQLSGLTGSHTLHSGVRPQTGAGPVPDPGRGAAPTGAVEERAADSTLARPAEPESTMVASSGGVDQTMVARPDDPAPERAEADPQATGLLPTDETGVEPDDGPKTQFFNSTLRPEEFRDILTPVQDRRGRATPDQTAMFEADTHDDDHRDHYEPYYDPHFDDHGDEPRRFPSLILIPMLLIVVGLTLMVPTMGFVLGLLCAVVLGALDTVKSEHARRIMERGPSNTDHVVAALSFPWALVRRLGRALAYGGLYLLGGIIIGMILGLTPLGEFSANYVGGYALAIVVLLSFLGPDGHGARRQANWLVEKVGIRNPYVYWGSIVAVCLAALFFLVFGFQVTPDWRPIAAPGAWFGG